MTTPGRPRRADPDLLSPEMRRLMAVMEEVAAGDYSFEIHRLAEQGESEAVRRMAEAMGMMVAQVEAREVRLEQLVYELRQLHAALQQSILQTVLTIANALGARDPYTRGHDQRVADYAARLARRIGLPEESVEHVRIGSLLHDIGKIGFSDRLFTHARAELTEDIHEEIKQHPSTGVRILEHLDFLGPALDCVHYHHERLDGTGYPRGLTRDAIPLVAQVTAVADCFDALTSDRPYQTASTQEEALATLQQLRGSTLSATLVDAFVAEIQENGMVGMHRERTGRP